jgi:hypothetical protein
VKKDWLEHEFRNWSRWCNGDGMIAGRFLPWGVSVNVLFPDDEVPAPIHEENAKIVQRIFDSSVTVEQKVLQAEYLSPWKYARYSLGIDAAVHRLNKDVPGLGLSARGYETILASVKRRVERAFT